MIENFAPGAIERLGLGYDVIRAINPAIIFCQVKGFGAGSPYEKNLAFDMIAQACGGPMSITGEEDGPPCKPGATIGDTGTGMLMAVSILGAYVRRLRTGQGEHLQVAMQDAVLHYIRNAFAYMERTDGKAAPRAGAEDRRRRQSADRGISLQGRRSERLCLYLHQRRQSGALDPSAESHGPRGPYRRCALRQPRRAHGASAEVDRIVSEWTVQHDKYTAMQLVGGATIPAGAVLDTKGTRRRSDVRSARHPADHEASGRR